MAAATLRAQLNRFRPQLGDLVTSIVVAVYLLLFLNVTFWSKAGLYLKNDPGVAPKRPDMLRFEIAS